MNKGMKKYYVTFGLGSPFSNLVLCIRGNNEEEVREALSRTAKGWCSILDPHQYINLSGKLRHVLVHSPKDAASLGIK